MGEPYWSNKKRVLGMLKRNIFYFKNIDDELKNDKDFILTAVQEIRGILFLAPKQFQDDKEVIIAAVQKNGCELYDASKRLRDDKEVVLAAVKQAGEALQWASKQLQDDKEVVMEAVKQNCEALQYASERLQDDRDVVMEAVKSGKAIFSALRYSSKRLQDDKEIVLVAIKKDKSALQYASGRLRSDKEVIAIAIRKNNSALEYVSEEFWNNEELFSIVIEPLLSEKDYKTYVRKVKNLSRYIKNSELTDILYSMGKMTPLNEEQNCFYKAPPEVIGKALKGKEIALKFVEWNPMCTHWLSKEMLEDTDIMVAVAEALTDQPKWVVESVGEIFDTLK